MCSSVLPSEMPYFVLDLPSRTCLHATAFSSVSAKLIGPSRSDCNLFLWSTGPARIHLRLPAVYLRCNGFIAVHCPQMNCCSDHQGCTRQLDQRVITHGRSFLWGSSLKCLVDHKQIYYTCRNLDMMKQMEDKERLHFKIQEVCSEEKVPLVSCYSHVLDGKSYFMCKCNATKPRKMYYCWNPSAYITVFWPHWALFPAGEVAAVSLIKPKHDSLIYLSNECIYSNNEAGSFLLWWNHESVTSVFLLLFLVSDCATP